jgi:ADP-ribose pyrophosphatase YjhB (NUDIX family)
VSRIQHYVTAGGVLVNKKQQLLLLERHVHRAGNLVHEIRLPKGHVDPGEALETCALREVGEESGYWDLEITAFLGVTNSRFHHENKEIQRTEYYYLMAFPGDDEKRGQPQPVSEEEALFEALWLAPDEACRSLSFSSEKEMARRARLYLKQR